MSDSPLLLIPEIAENQANKYITHNNAVKYLEQALSRAKTNTTYVSNVWTIGAADFTRYFAFKPSGAAANFSVKTPTTVGVTSTERMFVVWNADTTYTATIRSEGTGRTVDLPPGAIGFFMQVGVDVDLLFRYNASASDALPYDVGFFVSGKPAASQVVMVLVATRAFTLPDDFAGSKYFNGANPTGNPIVFDVQKNESSIGSISVTSGGVATFATTGAGVSMAIGDRLKVVAPSTQDATCADISVVFRGTRV